jgi:hypothetical protein
MLENKQNLQNFVIVQDGEVVNNEYQPSAIELARESVLNGIHGAIDHVKLESRMLVFDALHGTDYRTIRHDLIEKQKRERFEASIGLIAVGKKGK